MCPLAIIQQETEASQYNFGGRNEPRRAKIRPDGQGRPEKVLCRRIGPAPGEHQGRNGQALAEEKKTLISINHESSHGPGGYSDDYQSVHVIKDTPIPIGVQVVADSDVFTAEEWKSIKDRHAAQDVKSETVSLE
jgi:hypothetical protein